MSGRGVVIPDRKSSAVPPSATVDDDDRFVMARRRPRSRPAVDFARAKGIALYSRYSSPNSDEGSETRQFQGAESQAAKMGEPIVGLYGDRGISGATLERPGIKALLQDANELKFGLIVVESVSRLGRDLGQLLFVFDKLERLKVEIWTSAGARVDRHRLCVDGLLAQLERFETASITRRGRHLRFNDGVLCYRASFGFRLKPRFPGHRFRHPRRAATVAEIYRRVVEGEPPNAIAASFTRLRRPCPSDCIRLDAGKRSKRSPWTSTMIHQIVRNPLNAGLMTDGKTMEIKDPDTLKVIAIEMRDPSLWDLAAFAEIALVDAETWLKANAVLSPRRLTKGPLIHRPVILLDRSTRCFACGGEARLKYGNNENAWYRCMGTAGCEGFGSPTRAAVEDAVLRAVHHAKGEASPEVREALRLIGEARPFIARSTSDHQASMVVRNTLESVAIHPREAGIQLVDVTISGCEGDTARDDEPRAIQLTIELRETEDPDAGIKACRTDPLTAEERLKLIPEAAWLDVAGIVSSSGLCLKLTGWMPRALLEMMLLFCLTDRRLYDVPSNLGPRGRFAKAARRAVSSGFWDNSLTVLRRAHPFVVSGARTNRIDRFRGDGDSTDWTADHAVSTAEGEVRPDIRQRLMATAEVMKGKRLDLIASRRLKVEEATVAAWVVMFRHSGPDWAAAIECNQDEKVREQAAGVVRRLRNETDDPQLGVRLRAIECYLNLASREEIAIEAGVSWFRVRKWITGLMTSGLADLAPGRPRSILTAEEIAQLRATVVGRVDPDHDGAPVSGKVLQRICRETFGRELCVNAIMMQVAKGWVELQTGEINLSSGVQSKILHELKSIMSDELDALAGRIQG